MKLNWGASIVIAFVLFIGFIMFMVVQMMSKQELEHDLVVESYYQKELTYQDDLDSAQNAADLDKAVDIYKTAEGLSIVFPSEFEPDGLKGEVYFYRPSDKTLDFTVKLETSKPEFVIPNSLIQTGRWNVNLKFTYQDTNYFIQKEIRY
jgi:nitrogen fixation protein FixH